MTSPLAVLCLVVVTLLVGFLCGLWRAGPPGSTSGRREAQEAVRQPSKAGKRRLSASKLIAMGVLLIDGSSTYIVLYLCRLAIITRYEGALPYLTALIGALQAATAIVLSGYFYKSGKENSKGGITYDAALGNVSDSDTDL